MLLRRRLALIAAFGLGSAAGAAVALSGCPPTQRRDGGPNEGPVPNPYRDKQAPQAPGAFWRDCPPIHIPGEAEECRTADDALDPDPMIDELAREPVDPLAYPDTAAAPRRAR